MFTDQFIEDIAKEMGRIIRGENHGMLIVSPGSVSYGPDARKLLTQELQNTNDPSSK